MSSADGRELAWQARTVVFIDVQSGGSETALDAALDRLALDPADRGTELVAVGDWRAVGDHVARILAGRGATLLDVATSPGGGEPALAIAVAAGLWLGRALPGDRLAVVSANPAFEAVGDAVAATGVAFRLVSYEPPFENAPGAAGSEREIGGGRRSGHRSRSRR